MSPLFQAATSAGEFGDGSDGDVTLGAGTTTLTRDMLYRRLILPAGAILNPNGYRVYVSDLLDVQAGGAIRRNPGAAAFGVAAAALPNGVLAGTYPAPNGTVGAGAAGAATAQAVGGGGGAGGAGSAGGGGAGGAVVWPAARGAAGALPMAASGHFLASNVIGGYEAGSSGGAGGGDGVNVGGAGGVGGAPVVICARYVDLAGSIEAKGGDAGHTAAGNCGGGGGGGGGVIVLVRRLRRTNAGVVSVDGGAGGQHTGTGVTGAAGAVGRFIELEA